jgi:hypothetical protein
MKRDFKREKWMAQFEDEVCKLAPQHRGKIEWDTATYFYNQAMGWREAARAYAENRE